MAQQEISHELMMKFQMFEKQIQQLQEQIQAVEQGIVELSSLFLGLDDLKNSDGKEILSPIGKGIFVKSKIISEELVVDIGNQNFVTKTIDDTKKLIDSQVQKLEGIKKELNEALENLGQELEKTMQEYSGEEEGHDCKCHPGEKCDCDDDECDGKECGCGKD
jgi:prefoldin alpha subunit